MTPSTSNAVDNPFVSNTSPWYEPPQGSGAGGNVTSNTPTTLPDQPPEPPLPGIGSTGNSSTSTTPSLPTIGSTGNSSTSTTPSLPTIGMTTVAGSGQVSTGSVLTGTTGFVGKSGFSGDGGRANSALLSTPAHFCISSTGNIYIVDSDVMRIRRVDSQGIITSIMNFAPATVTSTAPVLTPVCIAVDSNEILYISFYDVIRKYTGGVTTGVVVAGTVGSTGYSGDGGPATSAQLNIPMNMIVNSNGSIIFSDSYNNRVRYINSTGVITTIAGNGTAGFSGDGGPATSAQLHRPRGICVDSNNNIYIADFLNNCVRKITNSTISTVAGTGGSTYGYSRNGTLATSAYLYFPTGVAVNSTGELFISDTSNSAIRMVGSDNKIKNVAGIWSALYGPNYVPTVGLGTNTYGVSGDGISAVFSALNYPTDIVISSSDIVYFSDNMNNRIRCFRP